MSKRLNSLLKVFDKKTLKRELLLTIKKIFNMVKEDDIKVNAASIIILAVCKQVLACLKDLHSGNVDDMLEEALEEDNSEEAYEEDDAYEDGEEDYEEEEDAPAKKVVRRKAKKAKPLGPDDVTSTGRPKSKYDKKILPKKSAISVTPHGAM